MVNITTAFLCNLNCYMFQHFPVIIRQFTTNALLSYTRSAIAAVGNTVCKIKMFHSSLYKCSNSGCQNHKKCYTIIKMLKYCLFNVVLVWCVQHNSDINTGVVYAATNTC